MPKLDILKNKTRESNNTKIVKALPCHDLLMDIYNLIDIKSDFHLNTEISTLKGHRLLNLQCEMWTPFAMSSNDHILIDVVVTFVFGECLFKNNDRHCRL